MTANSLHAVLTAHELLCFHDNKWHVKQITPPFYMLPDLCNLVDTTKITHLWVWPGLVAPNRAYFKQACQEWDLFGSWNIDAEVAAATGEEPELISVTGFRLPKGGRKQVNIAFVENCQWSFCDEDLTPKRLLLTLKLLEDRFGIVIGAGPTTAGMNLLKMLTINHPEWLATPKIDLLELPFKDAAKEIIWERALTGGELQGKYVVKLDKRSAYLRGCVASTYGTGTPIHVFHGQGIEEHKIGVWHVHILARPEDNSLLPPVVAKHIKEGWFMAPTIQLLQGQGYTLKIDEGWVFPTPKGQKRGGNGIMKEWGQKLFAARMYFKHQDEPANMRPIFENCEWACKDIATATVGLFGSPLVKGTWKARPDIHAQTISTHTSTMHYNIQKIWNESRQAPFMVYMDALYYACDTPNPIESGEIQGLTLAPETLGMYKLEWSIPLKKALPIIQSTDAPNVKLGHFNDIAEDGE